MNDIAIATQICGPTPNQINSGLGTAMNPRKKFNTIIIHRNRLASDMFTGP